MNDGPDTPHVSPFDTIRRTDEQGNEYWSARDLAKILGYATNYRNFKPVTHGSLCFTKLDDKPLHTEEISIDSAVEIGSGGRLFK